MKFCPKCRKTKSLKAFNKNQKRYDGIQGWCSSCRCKNYQESPKRKAIIAKATKWNYSHPEQRLKIIRKSNWKRLHGLTETEFLSLLKLQKSKCAICKQSFPKFPSVDHNHKTGKIRGLLCGKRNSGLGFFKDTVKFLRNAIRYLNAND